MNFDIKDVKSWSNRYDVKIGDEGYFSHSIDNLRNSEKEYIKPVKTKLVSLGDNDAMCFQIEHTHDGDDAFEFFLPLDKVKEKEYQPFKDAYELYKFFLPSTSCTREEFHNKLLLNLSITYRKRDTRNFTTTELITSVEDAIIDSCHLTIINGKELNYWFKNYEIEINGEWQPFGILN